MEPKNIKPIKGPEAIIQEAIVEFLEMRKWYVKVTQGNAYQSGFPDLYATHAKYGPRWIEVKNPLSYKFTPAQITDFHLLTGNGTQIWIMVAATEAEYQKLFKGPNWFFYLDIMKWNNG